MRRMTPHSSLGRVAHFFARQRVTQPSRDLPGAAEGRDFSTGRSYPARGNFSLPLDRALHSEAPGNGAARSEKLSRVSAWRSLFTKTAQRGEKQHSRMLVRPSRCPYPNRVSAARGRRGTRGNNGYKCSGAASTSRRPRKAPVASSDRDRDSRMDFRSSSLQTPG